MILLASRSAARQRMLADAGVPFALVDAALDERATAAGLDLPAPELALALAHAKAGAASVPAGALVLGADQVLELDDGRILAKAADPAEAAAQLAAMSGRTHRLVSAAALLRGGAPVWQAAETAVMHVRPLSEAFIAAYLAAEWAAVRWSVGCYHVEGRGAQLFESVEGSHFAVQGLPLLPLLGELRAIGVMAS